MSAAVRSLVTGAVGRTHAIMRNEPTTADAIASQANDVESLLPMADDSPARGSSTGPVRERPASGVEQQLAAVALTLEASFVGGNISQQVVRIARTVVLQRELVRRVRVRSIQQLGVNEYAVELGFEIGDSVLVPIERVLFRAPPSIEPDIRALRANPAAPLDSVIRRAVARASEYALGSSGLLELGDDSDLPELLRTASDTEIQTARALRTGASPNGQTSVRARALKTNSRLLLLARKQAAQRIAAGLRSRGVRDIDLISILSLGTERTSLAGQRQVLVSFVQNSRVETVAVDFTPSEIFSTLPAEVEDTSVAERALDAELTFAVRSYLGDAAAKVMSAEDAGGVAQPEPDSVLVASPTGTTSDRRMGGSEAIARLLAVPLARASRAARRVLVRSVLRDARTESDRFLARLTENPNDAELSVYDSLIVGAGVHGATFATTLNREDEDHRALILEQSESIGANFGLLNDAVTLNSRNDAESEDPLTRGRGNINPIAGPVQVPDIAGNRWPSARALAEVTALSVHTSGARLALGSQFESWSAAPQGAPAKYVITFKQKSTGKRFRVLANRIVFSTGAGEADIGLTDEASVAFVQSERARFNEQTPDERPLITTAGEEARLNALSATPRDAYRARGRQSAPRTLYTGFGDYSRVNLETHFGEATPDLYDGDGQSDFAQRGEVGDATFLTGVSGPETCNELLDGNASRNLQGSRARYAQLASPVRSGRLALQRGRLTALRRITTGAERGKVLATYELPPSLVLSRPDVVRTLWAAIVAQGGDPSRVVRIDDDAQRAGANVVFERPDGSAQTVAINLSNRGYRPALGLNDADEIRLLPEALRDVRLVTPEAVRELARTFLFPLVASRLPSRPLRARLKRPAAGAQTAIELLYDDGTLENVAIEDARVSPNDALLAAQFLIAQRGLEGDVYDRVVLGTGFRSTLAQSIAPADESARQQPSDFLGSQRFQPVLGARGRPVAKRFGDEEIYVAGASLGQTGVVEDSETRSVRENRASIFLLGPRTEELARIIARSTRTQGRVGSSIARLSDARTDFAAGAQRDFVVSLPPRGQAPRYRPGRERAAFTLELKTRVADVLDRFRFVNIPRVSVAFTRGRDGALLLSAPGMREGDVARLASAFAADDDARNLIESATRGGDGEELRVTVQTRASGSSAYLEPANRGNDWTIRAGSIRLSGM